MLMKRLLIAVLFASGILRANEACAQVTEADYSRASEIGKKYSELLLNMPDTPVWIDGGDTFLYRKTVAGGHELRPLDGEGRNGEARMDVSHV